MHCCVTTIDHLKKKTMHCCVTTIDHCTKQSFVTTMMHPFIEGIDHPFRMMHCCVTTIDHGSAMMHKSDALINSFSKKNYVFVLGYIFVKKIIITKKKQCCQPFVMLLEKSKVQDILLNQSDITNIFLLQEKESFTHIYYITHYNIFNKIVNVFFSF